MKPVCQGQEYFAIEGMSPIQDAFRTVILTERSRKIVVPSNKPIRRTINTAPRKIQGVSKWNVFFENATVAKLLNILARTDAF